MTNEELAERLDRIERLLDPANSGLSWPIHDALVKADMRVLNAIVERDIMIRSTLANLQCEIGAEHERAREFGERLDQLTARIEALEKKPDGP